MIGCLNSLADQALLGRASPKQDDLKLMKMKMIPSVRTKIGSAPLITLKVYPPKNYLLWDIY